MARERKRMRTYAIAIFTLLITFLCTHVSTAHAHSIYYYLDGQDQRAFGAVIETDEGLWLPARSILQKLQYVNEEWELDNKEISDFIRSKVDESFEWEEEIDFLIDVHVELMNNELMIHLQEVKNLGFDAYYFKKAHILHVNTPSFMEIADLSIGQSKADVEKEFPEVHWNTGFGQAADVIGFIGSMHSYSYVDRYGYERKGEVPDIQVEIKNDRVSYILVSSNKYPTSKNVKVGDSLRTVYAHYGSNYVRDRVDNKEVIVYDAEFGSIWFIGNEDNEIERIGYWDHHLRGFGKEIVTK